MNLILNIANIIEKITKRQFITYILRLFFCFIFLIIASWFFRNYSMCATFLFDDSTKSNGELAKFAATIAGGMLVFYGLLINARRTKALETQNEISRDGQVGERFKNAIEHLGSKNHAIILGGIHALHRIANENESYRPVVFEILCSYIREKTHLIKLEGEDDEQGVDPEILQWIKPTIVIQTIVDVLFKPYEPSNYIYATLFADLKGVKCMNVDFSNARFDHVDFSNARLEYANFQSSTLDYARFNGSKLYKANFWGCLLRSVNFKKCTMFNANFINTICREANFDGSYLSNALFIESDLSNAKLNSSILKNTHFELSNLADADLTDTLIRGTHFEASVLIRTIFTDSDIKDAHFEGAAPFEFRTGHIEIDLHERIGKAADLGKIAKNESNGFLNTDILTEEIKERIIDLYNKSLELD